MSRKIKVLVAEDDALVGADFAELLSEQRYQVIGPYRDLHQAVRAYERERPDIALLEMRLRHGARSDGLARRILGEGGRVVLLTAGLQDDRGALSRLPGAAALEKPVHPRKLVELLKELNRPPRAS